MNVLVTGAKGQLGSEIRYLVKDLGYKGEDLDGNAKTQSKILHPKFLFTDKEELDITNKEAVKKFINDNDIDLVINCAAYTAVDKAESEQELADLINHKAVKYLSNECKIKDIPLIHISTDYVFDGKNYRPYVESDKVNPQGVYGLTKLKGEEAFIKSGAKGIIIRTSWVYSTFGHNFVKTVLRLAKSRNELNVIFDQVGTPTYARDLAEAILGIVRYRIQNLGSRDRDVGINDDKLQNSKSNILNPVEIYHYSNEGVCSWYDFAKAIFEISGIDMKVNPIETKDYPTPAKRPHYSVLNKSKIKREFNLEIPYWRDSLKRCLERLNDE